MTETIVFPSVENITILTVTATLVGLGETAEVHKTVPAQRPARFVTIDRAGGPKHSLVVDAAQLNVESWGTNDDDAHDLAQLVRAAVNAMTGQVCEGVQVYFVNEISGPGNLPDPVSFQARYVQSFEVSMRGAAA